MWLLFLRESEKICPSHTANTAETQALTTEKGAMPTAFVTGSTGFLGRHVVDVLRERNWTIFALVRDEARARALLGDGVTFIQGDITLASSYRNALPQAYDCTFHIAADTSTWAQEADRQQRINVEGTAGLLQAHRSLDAKRFVHVSTIAVYGIHKTLVTETSEKHGKDSWVSYAQTKTMAERKVIEASMRGTDAVVVNPTHIVGRYDDHNWARLITMTNDGTLPGVPPGGGNFANGRAVAEAVVTAFDKGRTGENYILGGPYATMHEFLSLTADLLGRAQPGKPKPAFMLRTLASVLSLASRFTGKRPMITPEEAYFACEDVNASSEKAVRELDYREVPLARSLEECIAYLRGEGRL
jgi:nucleoside-diphosphate-sugar epimerase